MPLSRNQVFNQIFGQTAGGDQGVLAQLVHVFRAGRPPPDRAQGRPQPGRAGLLGQKVSTSRGNVSSAVSLMTRIDENATCRRRQTSATANVSMSTASARSVERAIFSRSADGPRGRPSAAGRDARPAGPPSRTRPGGTSTDNVAATRSRADRRRGCRCVSAAGDSPPAKPAETTQAGPVAVDQYLGGPAGVLPAGTGEDHRDAPPVQSAFAEVKPSPRIVTMPWSRSSKQPDSIPSANTTPRWHVLGSSCWHGGQAPSAA